MARVPAVHVERGIGFGIAGFLRLAQGGGEIHPAFGHAREDVVARPVHDPAHAQEMVRDKCLLDRLDDRDAAGHRRLVEDRDAFFRGQTENLRAVLGEQRLVRRHDHFPAVDRFEDHLARFLDPAHQLDNNIDRGILEEQAPVGHHLVHRQRHGALARRVALGDLAHDQVATQPLAQQGAVLPEVDVNPGAHGAETGQSYAYFTHR